MTPPDFPLLDLFWFGVLVLLYFWSRESSFTLIACSFSCPNPEIGHLTVIDFIICHITQEVVFASVHTDQGLVPHVYQYYSFSTFHCFFLQLTVPY